ncbi:MAG: molecular chaperone DnaJ [Candidatus Gastranaerophilales bacterium]|nr:molecular chaperone DnaJ [Candidatus Gastranaerophilales bacterium]
MDYYEILGVSKNADKDEIKGAFRRKARQYHPDVNKSHDAEEKFKELGKAYETLMDEDKRALYDRYGEDGLRNAGFDNGGPFAGGFGDLNDIFNSFFGNFGFRQADPNAPQRGDDLRTDIEIEFEEAVFGVTREIKIDHLELCQSCKGSGAEPGSSPITCPTCGGSGRVQQTTQTILGHFTQVTTCPDCHGSGQKINNPCKACKGYGRIEKEKSIELKIPAGVDNGSKMRISQEGDAGKNGGQSGDLYVVLHVKQSDYYHREGFNVYTKLEIAPSQAALGDEVTIKTLDGEKTVNIHAGSQNGDDVRLKGVGVPFLGKSSQRGDHIVIIEVKIPTNLTEEEKQLYKKLYEINTKKTHHDKESFIDKVKGVFN